METTKKSQLDQMKEGMATQNRVCLDVTIDAPVLVLPIDAHSEWRLEMGVMQLNSIDSEHHLILRHF